MLCVLFLFLFGVYFFYQRGRLSIDNLPEGTTSVEIMKQDETTATEVVGDTFTKTLKSGTYTILIKNGNESQILTAEVGSFFSNTSVTAALVSQQPREFVAENPRGCITAIAESFLSYPCDGPVSGIVFHVPANESMPTFTRKVRAARDEAGTQKSPEEVGVIEDFVDLNGKKLLLAYTNGEYGALHSVYEMSVVQNEPTLLFLGSLDSLGDELFYVLKDSQGIVLRGKKTPIIYKGADFNKLSLASEESRDNLLSYDGSTDLSSFIFSKSIPKNGGDEYEVTQAGTTLEITSLDKSIEKKFTGTINRVSFCGDYVCVINEKKSLTLFDKNLSVVVSIAGVSDYRAISDTIFIVKDSAILYFDTTSLDGYILYSNTDFKLSGLRTVDKTIFAVINSGQKEHLLRLGAGDFVDQALPALFENPFINTLSIYKKFIFASPELGERIPTERGLYEYDPAVKAAAKLSIDQTIDQVRDVLTGYNFLAVGL